MVDLRVAAQDVLDGGVHAVGLRERGSWRQLDGRDEEAVVAVGEEGRREQRDREQAQDKEPGADPHSELAMA